MEKSAARDKPGRAVRERQRIPAAQSRRGVALLGLPTDVNSSYVRGAARAPAEIRKALFSPASNMSSETGVDLGAPGLLIDEGNLALAEELTDATRIERGVAALYQRGLTPLLLGGDHSVTYPVMRAVAAAHRSVSILHFDAHPDLYDVFEGSRLSHACPFARIMEEQLADRLIQVGIRTMTGHQRAQARRFGVEVIEMRDIQGDLRVPMNTPVYVSIDVDALDPAFAPGVSHREPGGLSVRQLLSLLHGIEAPIIAADVVELNPRNDPSGLSAMVAGKVVRELIGVMLK